MTPGLVRGPGRGRPAAPVRLVHLGLGNFFRAHQAWYTDQAPDAAEWGYAAFAGRSAGLAAVLEAQGGLYTLVTRGAKGDRFEVVSSLSRVHGAEDHEAWLACFRSPDVAAVTVPVTEAGYLRAGAGGLDAGRPEVRADIEVLRRDRSGAVRTAPGRLLAGVAARREADAGPIALVPCDNVPGNGAMLRRVLEDLAERVDDALAGWLAASVAVVSTVVDRITPRTDAADLAVVAGATGAGDRCPVVCEPFSEWVLSGTFPAGRPQWEQAGAITAEDLVPFEDRKLWLLNGAHSLLAYTGPLRGLSTVAEAASDERCRAWLEEWWATASPHLAQAEGELAAYRAALTARFSNPRIGDRLERIAADGSQKLPIRILPVLRAERAAGRFPPGATRVLAAWICHLRGFGAPVNDARAGEVVPLAAGPPVVAAERVLRWLDPALGDDGALVAGVTDLIRDLTAGTTANG